MSYGGYSNVGGYGGYNLGGGSGSYGGSRGSGRYHPYKQVEHKGYFGETIQCFILISEALSGSKNILAAFGIVLFYLHVFSYLNWKFLKV